MRKSNAERQADWRARQKAKSTRIAELEAEPTQRPVEPRLGPAAEDESSSAVVESLARIQSIVEAQNAYLRRASWVEHAPLILRRLTELERLIRGSDMHVPSKHTRGRPLGTS